MGKIEVTICGARSLHNSQSVGVADPYVRILIDDKNYKTKVVKENLAPEWSETFRFMIADEMSSQLRFEVWNNRTFSDDLLGYYTMSVGGLTKGVVKDQWYILEKSKTQAELHVRVLALDFGRAPKPEEEWMVTQNINIDPVQRAIEEGRYKPGQKTAPTPPAGPGQPVPTAQQPPAQQYAPQQQPQYAPQQPQQYPPQQQPQYAPPPQQYAPPPQGYAPHQPQYAPQYAPQQPQYAPQPPPQGYAPQYQQQPPQGYYPPPPQGYAPPPQGYPPQGYAPQQPYYR